MLKLRVGGVAEHYNLPWHLLGETGKLEGIGVAMQWQDCPGGTGEMTRLLESNELDLAVLLTEGMVAERLKGSKSKILKVFVKSSLEWGVHVSKDVASLDQDQMITFGVSRFGSGSHHMAKLYAHTQGIPKNRIAFSEVGSLDGAMEAFNKRAIDVFLWERFTTEPYCHVNNLKRIDSIYTPWPCFVIAARSEFYQANQRKVDDVLDLVINQAEALKQHPNAIEMITARYDLPAGRVAKWFETVEWGSGENLSASEIETVVKNLKQSGDLAKEIESFEKQTNSHTTLLSA